MAKKTLLEMVQNILSAMDSDEVNSISDTVEAMQVAEEVKTTYEDLVSTLKIPERRSLIQLESLGDTTRPNYLKIPDNVQYVHWLRYNEEPVAYKPPEEFINYVLETGGSVTVSDFGGVSYNIENDLDPRYWTSFDDEYMVFSSFNQANESTLQESNTLAYADLLDPFQLSDDYIPNIDANLFPLLLSEAKASCFVNLKQVSNADVERKARRQLVRVQNDRNRSTTGAASDRLPDYGRRR